MSRRSGAALLELLTVTCLLGIVATACAVLVHAQSRLLRDSVERTATSEAIRGAHAILDGDLRSGGATDLRAVAADSLAIRVMRGSGIVCAVRDGNVALRYRGMRLPDAEKDSLLVAGDERVSAFSNTTATASCVHATDEELVTIRPAAPLRQGTVLLFFESGAYHLATNALRYRRGLEGKQPLTDERIDERKSRFAVDASGRGIRVLLTAVAPRRQVPVVQDFRVRFLNGQP